VAAEIAEGRNPADKLKQLRDQPTVPQCLTVRVWTERFLDSRIDIDENTRRNYRVALRKVGETFGDRDPANITAAEIAEWVAGIAKTHKPGTIQLYVIAFRLLLDHVGIEPNAARDRR
jgi:hypothetical protein